VAGRLAEMGYDSSERTTPELLGDFAAIMAELTVRDVIRTNNNPIGDIAEAVVADHYGGERGSFSQRGWDVKGPDGELIQVKSLRAMPGKQRTALSPISDDDYDSVVVLIFNEAFQVTEGLKLTRGLVEDLFARNTKGQRIVRVSQKLKDNPLVETVDFSDAASWLKPIVE
jgi:hypothetical protein